MARSSTEAEYRALAHTTSELLWLESFLHELQVPFQPPTLMCDNLGAVQLSHNPILHARTKHIELDIHFVRECVISKLLKIQHVPSSMQLADTLTKPLGTTAFQELCTKLKVVAISPP